MPADDGRHYSTPLRSIVEFITLQAGKLAVPTQRVRTTLATFTPRGLLVPRLSIIIPVLGNIDLMEDTLVSVLENRPDDCEIIVVLRQMYDDPYDLKDEIRFVQAPSDAGLAASANLGISKCEADIVHLLVCGAEVSEGWADVAMPLFDDPNVAAVAPLVLDPNDRQRVVTAGVTYTPGGAVRVVGRGTSPMSLDLYRQTALGPDARAAFYRKSALEKVGRLVTEVGDELVGVDLALALRYAGFRALVEPQCRVYCLPATLATRGAFLRAFQAERLFWRWAPGRGWLRSLASHGIAVAAECWQSLPRPTVVAQLTGRLVGSYRIVSYRRRGRDLRRLRQLPQAAGARAGRTEFVVRKRAA